MSLNHMSIKFKIPSAVIKSFASFFLLTLFLADCNQAKPISIDTSSPAGLLGLVLQQEITQNNASGGGPSLGFCGGQCVIFSSFEVAGVVSTNGGAIGGIANADALCQTAAASLPAGYGAPSEYRALIMATGGLRDLTHNWVLHPNTTYLNPNNSKTVATDSNKMFQFPGGATFSSSTSVWTGIDATGTSWAASANDCANWTDKTISFSGRNGWTAIAKFVDLNGTASCNSFATGLFCVRF